MGNSLSYQNVEQINNETTIKSINKDNLVDLIDSIAANFILKQNMIDMVRFTDKSYYDNLIILTSTIVKKELTDLELGILKDRVLNSVNNNTNSINGKKNENNNSDDTGSNNIYFTTANDLRKISLSNEKEKEKALLIISKFYIKIMTIFSAIVSVIDPQYMYEAEDGIQKYFYLKDFNDYKMIQTDDTIRIHQIYNPNGLLKKRLTILKNKMSEMNNNSENIILNPGELFCSTNTEFNNMASVQNEIGIKELDALYYDVFDYETKSWNIKSDKMQKRYEKDLTKFYQIFTGKKNKPSSVQSFEDIETLQFHQLQRCKNKEFYKDLIVSKTDKLFLKYSNKIHKIEEISNHYKLKLMKVLKSIFVVKNENNTIIINPDLTLDKLIKFQEKTKEYILNIYTNCEKYFIEALLIYEQIYDEKFGVLQNQRLNDINTINNNAMVNQNRPSDDSKTPNILLNNELLNTNNQTNNQINNIPTDNETNNQINNIPTDNQILTSPTEVSPTTGNASPEVSTPIPTPQPMMTQTPILTPQPMMTQTPISTYQPMMTQTPISTYQPMMASAPIPTYQPMMTPLQPTIPITPTSNATLNPQSTYKPLSPTTPETFTPNSSNSVTSTPETNSSVESTMKPLVQETMTPQFMTPSSMKYNSSMNTKIPLNSTTNKPIINEQALNSKVNENPEENKEKPSIMNRLSNLFSYQKEEESSGQEKENGIQNIDQTQSNELKPNSINQPVNNSSKPVANDPPKSPEVLNIPVNNSFNSPPVNEVENNSTSLPKMNSATVNNGSNSPQINSPSMNASSIPTENTINRKEIREMIGGVL